MLHRGSRTIKVNKKKLIEQIEANKEAHVKEYNDAVIAFKKESLKQLSELTKKAENGEINTVKLDLIYPVNNSENYDKIIQMFEWEVNDEVELSQDEFLQYVQDENSYAENAKFANMAYMVQ